MPIRAGIAPAYARRMALTQIDVPRGTAAGTERWQRLIHSVFGTLDLDLGDPARFAGSIRHAALAEVELAEVSSAHENAVRTRRHVAGDRREAFVFVMPLAGRLEIEQGGQQCALVPGRFALFDLSAPHRYFHDAPLQALSLKAPCAMLRERSGRIDDLVATAFAADVGVARIAFDFIGSLLRERANLPERLLGCYGERIADLTALMLDGVRGELPLGPSAVRHALYRRCVQAIETRLGDPQLNPERIAAACGISTRYLHKVFQDSGQSVGDYLRERRLCVCRERLVARGGERQIKDIALSAGFRSVSHFSNAFKARFGVAPREAATAGRLQ
jgi:AraC-like DNA-binding protein